MKLNINKPYNQVYISGIHPLRDMCKDIYGIIFYDSNEGNQKLGVRVTVR